MPYSRFFSISWLKTYGPVAVLIGLLDDVEGIQEAYIFGSWARRYEGETGRLPGDIDLLVVGTPDPEDVYEVCRKAEERLGNAVNPSILTKAEWTKPKSPLVESVKKGPRVQLLRGDE